MGVAYYLSFESEAPGFDASSVDGKALAANAEALNTSAVRLGVIPPDSYLSMSDEELEDLVGEELELDEPEGDVWFDAQTGVRSFEALLEDVRRNPSSYRRSEDLIDDLAAAIEALKLAAAKGVRFKLALDL